MLKLVSYEDSVKLLRCYRDFRFGLIAISSMEEHLRRDLSTVSKRAATGANQIDLVFVGESTQALSEACREAVSSLERVVRAIPPEILDESVPIDLRFPHLKDQPEERREAFIAAIADAGGLSEWYESRGRFLKGRARVYGEASRKLWELAAKPDGDILRTLGEVSKELPSVPLFDERVGDKSLLCILGGPWGVGVCVFVLLTFVLVASAE